MTSNPPITICTCGINGISSTSNTFYIQTLHPRWRLPRHQLHPDCHQLGRRHPECRQGARIQRQQDHSRKGLVRKIFSPCYWRHSSALALCGHVQLDLQDWRQGRQQFIHLPGKQREIKFAFLLGCRRNENSKRFMVPG